MSNVNNDNTSGSLTKRQKDVLDFISHYATKNGVSPSLREISGFLGTDNLGAAQHHIKKLTEGGYISKKASTTRGIRTLSPARTIPLLGVIAAGEPIEPIENPERVTVPFGVKLDSGAQHYALKVQGDSMIDMGILDGDVVLVKHQFTAINGDVVVAITEEGATLKIFKKDSGGISLLPRNKKYSIIKPKSLEIRGKFVGLLRVMQ